MKLSSFFLLMYVGEHWVELQLPHYRKMPMRHLDEESQPHRYDSPKDYYCHLYYEACDLLLPEIDSTNITTVTRKCFTNGEVFKEALQAAKLS